MKQRIPMIAALMTVASAGVALGCGCSSQSVRLQPVREIIVQKSSTCVMEPQSSVDWGAPFRTVGNVISAPFVAIGNAFTPSERYVAPVGERFVTTYPTYRERLVYESPTLMPVGERFTTVKIIRHRTLLQPVGERFIITKRYYKTTLRPVGERFTVVRHHKMLKPVGEKFIIVKHHKMLKPVGEQLTTEKRYHKTMLKPVGQHQTTLIKAKQW